MLFGHLAVSALEHRYANVEFVPVMAAAVVPDVVDKVAHYVFGQAESGRLWGHTLLGVALSSTLILILFGRRSALSWCVGYLSHLICDVGAVVPWLYPFVTYEFPPAYDFETTFWMGITNYPRTLLELTLSLWALLALRPKIVTFARAAVTRALHRTARTHHATAGESVTQNVKAPPPERSPHQNRL